MKQQLTLKERTSRYVASFLTEGYEIISFVDLQRTFVVVLRHKRNGNFLKVVTAEKCAFVYKRSSQAYLYTHYKLLKKDEWK